MKKTFLFFLLILTNYIFAQFGATDVKYFVGTGSQVAYVVVDFKDGTDDRSYAWGVRYNTSDSPNIHDLLEVLATNETAFTFTGTGFLDSITFNQHSQSSGDDYWSMWTGNSSTTFQMNGGMSETVINGKWYGFSYGFSNPTMQAPVTPIPAYSSAWFPTPSSVTEWIGTGSNYSVVVIDFGTDTNTTADSYAFGIKYNGTITADYALQLIANNVSNFSYTANNNMPTQVTYAAHTSTNLGSNYWKIYLGTNLSNWVTKTNLSSLTLENGQLLGLSFGTRRPYIPTPATVLATQEVKSDVTTKVYPNPTTDYLTVQTQDHVKEILIIDTTGKIVGQSKSKTIDFRSLPTAIYIVKVQTDKEVSTFKVIKK